MHKSTYPFGSDHVAELRTAYMVKFLVTTFADLDFYSPDKDCGLWTLQMGDHTIVCIPLRQCKRINETQLEVPFSMPNNMCTDPSWLPAFYFPILRVRVECTGTPLHVQAEEWHYAQSELPPFFIASVFGGVCTAQDSAAMYYPGLCMEELSLYLSADAISI
jgi:hypothetical protein